MKVAGVEQTGASRAAALLGSSITELVVIVVVPVVVVVVVYVVVDRVGKVEIVVADPVMVLFIVRFVRRFATSGTHTGHGVTVTMAFAEQSSIRDESDADALT